MLGVGGVAAEDAPGIADSTPAPADPGRIATRHLGIIQKQHGGLDRPLPPIRIEAHFPRQTARIEDVTGPYVIRCEPHSYSI